MQSVLLRSSRRMMSSSHMTMANIQHAQRFSLSTVAAAEEAVELSESSSPSSPSKQKKQSSGRVRRSLDPITVTPSAANRLQELLQSHSADDGTPVGIRLGTRKRGCNGLSYTLNYVYEKDEPMKKQEAVVTSSGVQVFIEPMALLNVIGTTMDWEETELSSEFTFTNPNSKGECGCGESFNV